jgi:signal transduction histidine kinase
MGDPAVVRVLLADDNPDDRFLVARQLRSEFEAVAIVEAGTPDAFRDAFPPPPYDLVVTDYQLHWTTGLDVIAAIRERDPACPIIMFTGTGSEEIAVEAMKAGLSDYVLKSPKHLGLLGPAARRAIEHRRQQDAAATAEAERRAAAAALARRNEELQTLAGRLESLSSRLLEVQETERRYLARELHDEIGQALTAVKISLHTARLQADRQAVDAVLGDTMAIVDQALAQVRSMSLQLRPAILDDLGLDAAARWLVAGQSQPPPAAILLDLDLPAERLPKSLETVCFRILQESLTNVARHARATSVSVSLAAHGGRVVLSVSDDGAGFDVNAALDSATRGRSLGLLNMLERAHLAGGRLYIESEPGSGTTMTAELPVPAAGEPPDAQDADPGESGCRST